SPSPSVWGDVLDRIHAGASLQPQPSRHPGYRWRSFLSAVGVAAAILVSVLLGRAFWPNVPVKPLAPVTVQKPFEIADGRDIVISSIDDEDTENLLVGKPPMVGPLELARPSDVSVVRSEPFVDTPSDTQEEGSDSPSSLPSAGP